VRDSVGSEGDESGNLGSEREKDGLQAEGTVGNVGLQPDENRKNQRGMGRFCAFFERF
jgi:hypothetical protein